MKSMTFDEFFAMPPGTVFGQATGLPHQFSCGLFLKGESWEHEEDGEYNPGFMERVLLDEDGESPPTEWPLRKIHAELDRLAGLIGRGPGRVAQTADMLSAAHEADRERRAIIDQISPDWPEMARLLGGGFADRLGLGTFRAIARDLKNTDR